ncbi:hypothetical protein THOM_3112, partial [Trachipleistophora hominis]
VMDVSYVLRENDDNLTVSDMYNEKIYYAKDSSMLIYDIYTNYKDTICSFESRIDDIKILKRNIYVFRGNKCDIFSMTYKEIKGTLRMKSLPVKIKKTSDIIALLSAEGTMHIIENERLINVRVYRGDEQVRILDFCTGDTSSFILSTGGEVFRSKNFAVTNRIFMNDPEKILPKCAFMEPLGVELNKERLYVLDGEGVHVFKVREHCLERLYTYKSTNMKALHSFENVFCYGDQLVLLDRVPYLLADEQIYTMLEDKAVGAANIYFTSSYDRQYEDEVKASELLKERNPDDRIEELFSKIVFRPNCTVEEYKTRIIDGIKSIYIELDSLNKSFVEKAKLVGDKGRAVKQKYDELFKRRKDVEEKLKMLNERIIHRVKEKENVKNPQLERMINELRHRMKTRKSRDYEDELKTIKLQNSIFKKYVEDIYR